MGWIIIGAVCLLAQSFNWIKPIDTPGWENIKQKNNDR